MTEIERILEQFRRAFEGEAWHGPALLPLLSDVNAGLAAAHPIQGTHSIWELVLHIGAWERACRLRLEGNRAQLSDAEDWPAVGNTSDQEWEKTKRQLVETHRELIAAIAKVDVSRLDKPIIEDESTQFSSVYVTLQGSVQHSLYHAGQIALLKKAQQSV